MRIVFDTNVYIAALKKGSLSYKILESVLEDETDFFIYTSLELKLELSEKLEEWKKKKLAGEHEINRLKFLVTNFIAEAIPTEKINQIKEDPDDNKILECAAAAEANIIITMDKHLLKLKVFRGMPILHPKTFSYILPKK